MSDLPQFLRDMLASPPKHGDPNGGVHRWMFRVARHLHYHRSPEDIFKLLKASLEDCGREVEDSELGDAINNSGKPGVAWEPGWKTKGDFKEPRKKRPEFDQARFDAVTGSNEFTLADWYEASPVRDAPTDEIVRTLFPGDPLLCIGWHKYAPITEKLSELTKYDLATAQFIVPNPMSKELGKNKKGKQSARCNDNAVEPRKRRYIVVDLDEGSLDQQAGVIHHLAQRYLNLAADTDRTDRRRWHPLLVECVRAGAQIRRRLCSLRSQPGSRSAVAGALSVCPDAGRTTR
jgi:hypothetical protein